MQYNLEFGTLCQGACAFTFRAEIPPAPAIKVFSIPDLIDQVVLSVYAGVPREFKKTQEKIRQLRLVSRAFFQAANPHFVVGLPFQKFVGREWMISPRITVCGPYIRSMDLRAGNLCDIELIKLIRGHCPNLEHVTLLFEDTMKRFSPRDRYLTFFENFFSSSSIGADDNNVKIKSLTGIILCKEQDVVEIGNVIDIIQVYLKGIEELNIEIQTSTPNSNKLLTWHSLESLLHALPNLVSINMIGVSLPWDEISRLPTRISNGVFPNLTRLSFCKISPSKTPSFANLNTITRLSLIFPRLEYLALDKLVSGNCHYGNSDNPNELEYIEDDAMTVRRMQIKATDVKALHELLKVTPELKSLACHTVRWRGRGRGPEDLKLLKDCTWDYLEIDGNISGLNLDNELKRYPPLTGSQ
ncbi:hypothetical protein BGX21_007330 [Mortierella sp. AD011]|nr:hypothetical protein BGX20_007362 [Mortierella sp. AD010]KAF9398743.1 hypothetical protein BGX21_007330 [Mortierella sp. AD011]